MQQKRSAYRKHYVEEKTNGKIRRYPVKEWAFNNKKSFPSKKFTNSTTDYPTTSQIVAVMVRDFGYAKTEENGEVILRIN